MLVLTPNGRNVNSSINKKAVRTKFEIKRSSVIEQASIVHDKDFVNDMRNLV
jgi:hypothetical protein